MGGKTSIQINVYRQTSPVPCSVSMSDGCRSSGSGWPQRDAGTQVLSAHAGLSGCLWAGIVVCPTGVTQAGVPQSLQSFASWASVTRLVGSTASAAALEFLRQRSEGGSVARDGERLLSVPQLVVFLRGFPHAVFPPAAPGSHGNPAYFPEMMLGSWISPLHPRTEHWVRSVPARSPEHSVGAEHLSFS